MFELFFRCIADLRDKGLTRLIAQQSVGEAHVVDNGRIALSGASGELDDDPKVRSANLGS